jgi:hypothetical protein
LADLRPLFVPACGLCAIESTATRVGSETAIDELAPVSVVFAGTSGYEMGSIRQGPVLAAALSIRTFLSSIAGRRRSIFQRAKEFTMRFKFNFGLAAIAMTCLAISALAQQPGQPGQRGDRGRGGPPGGGGFGMFGGNFTSRMSLLRTAEIRKELELADEQVAAIEMLDEELRAKYPMGRGGGPGGQPGGGRRGGNNNNEGALQTVPAQWYFVQQNQPPGQPGQGRGRGGPPQTPEEQAAMEKQRVERDREANAKLADILLPHQVKRLNEIYVQQAGTAALQDEEIAKLLGISDAQKAKLAEVSQQNRESIGAAMREMFQGGGGGGDRDANRAKMEELRKNGEAKVMALLSADQQKKFEEMKGKVFAMPEGRGGGPGGRGGPGGGRGPGGARPGGNN